MRKLVWLLVVVGALFLTGCSSNYSLYHAGEDLKNLCFADDFKSLEGYELTGSGTARGPYYWFEVAKGTSQEREVCVEILDDECDLSYSDYNDNPDFGSLVDAKKNIKKHFEIEYSTYEKRNITTKYNFYFTDKDYPQIEVKHKERLNDRSRVNVVLKGLGQTKDITSFYRKIDERRSSPSYETSLNYKIKSQRTSERYNQRRLAEQEARRRDMWANESSDAEYRQQYANMLGIKSAPGLSSSSRNSSSTNYSSNSSTSYSSSNSASSNQSYSPSSNFNPSARTIRTVSINNSGNHNGQAKKGSYTCYGSVQQKQSKTPIGAQIAGGEVIGNIHIIGAKGWQEYSGWRAAYVKTQEYPCSGGPKSSLDEYVDSILQNSSVQVDPAWRSMFD